MKLRTVISLSKDEVALRPLLQDVAEKYQLKVANSGSRKTGASGFGLGLNYVVLQVVSAHGGMVKVESVEGSYSEFTLQFLLR